MAIGQKERVNRREVFSPLKTHPQSAKDPHETNHQGDEGRDQDPLTLIEVETEQNKSWDIAARKLSKPACISLLAERA